MRRQLENELINAVMPYIDENNLSDVKMRLTMILSEYEVDKASRELIVWDGNKNEIMLKRFLAAKVAQGCTPRTIKHYRNEIIRMHNRIGKPYDEITADDIRLYLALRVNQDGVSKVTAKNERLANSAFYGWMQREEILLKNPMQKVEQMKITKKKQNAFSPMDVEKLRVACRTNRERAIIEVLLSTWCRVSEFVRIKLSDIDGNRIKVLGKGDKERMVYLNAKATLAIENYLAERKDNNPYLFPKAKYNDIRVICKKMQRRREQCFWYTYKSLVAEEGHTDAASMEEIVRNIGKRAGVEKTHPHRFRRTGATMALETGMPLITVSKLLGHESIATTQLYLDISDRELEQAHEKYVI